MINTSDHIKNFSSLGEKLQVLTSNANKDSFAQASAQNPWFTHDSIIESLKGFSYMLKKEKITQWLAPYDENKNQQVIGIVLAGNIPLVGFHDILCVLVSNHKAKVKMSSKDQYLYHVVFNELFNIEPAYKDQVEFTDSTLKGIDAIIATGSDNTARYFDYYFSKYPNVIRKNRSSIAIINGDETQEELEALADDVFMYFGLGCRNVSQIYIPTGFPLDKLFEAFEKYQHLLQHNKYFNNYEYQKTIHLLNLLPHLDNGFVLLKEDHSLTSPIGMVNYTQYSTPEEIVNFQQVNKHKIQCIVSKTKWPFTTYCLGEAQKPELWDYADGIDTLQFLSKLN